MTALPPAGDVAALILGAGSGVRMGNQAKAFLEAGGTTLLRRAVELVRPYCGEIVAGVRAEDVERGRGAVGQSAVRVVAGGATRQETVVILLSQVSHPIILLHEVARPFASPQLVEDVLRAGATHGAAVPFLPASERDAMGLREDDEMVAPLVREDVIFTQVPQAYARTILDDACTKAKAAGWQEQSTTGIVTRAGHRIRLVTGDPANIKITSPADWKAACEAFDRK